MATYITLGKFTREGVMSFKDSTQRRAAGREMAKSYGVDFKQFFLVMGRYDLVIIFDAPSDEAAAKFVLRAAGQGFISLQTMRAFDEAEADRLAASMP